MPPSTLDQLVYTGKLWRWTVDRFLIKKNVVKHSFLQQPLFFIMFKIFLTYALIHLFLYVIRLLSEWRRSPILIPFTKSDISLSKSPSYTSYISFYEIVVLDLRFWENHKERNVSFFKICINGTLLNNNFLIIKKSNTVYSL